MPDAEPVNISAWAKSIGNTLRNLHAPLYAADFNSNAIKPVMQYSLQLLLELRKERRTHISTDTQSIVINSTRNLEELYGNCQQLTTISDDLADQPSVKDRGELRQQWIDCRQALLNKLVTVADSLDMLSEATMEVGPLEGSVQTGDGEATGEAVL
jgi:hypothetical protein